MIPDSTRVIVDALRTASLFYASFARRAGNTTEGSEWRTRDAMVREAIRMIERGRGAVLFPAPSPVADLRAQSGREIPE